jgi:hypothetical protein
MEKGKAGIRALLLLGKFSVRQPRLAEGSVDLEELLVTFCVVTQNIDWRD